MLILAVLCIAAIAGADQLVKAWVAGNFQLGEERPFLQIGTLDILHLRYVENNGSAFSSFAGQRGFLLTVSIVGIVVCTYLLCTRAKGKPLAFWALTMVIGGAAGNLIDRIFRGGSVIDYLDVQLFSFAIFNLADCFVCVGIALLFVYILFFMEEKKPEERSHDTA